VNIKESISWLDKLCVESPTPYQVAWQTLKRFVLAKQTTNSRSKQSVDNALEVGDGSDY
jgi:hypothetical protein